MIQQKNKNKTNSEVNNKCEISLCFQSTNRNGEADVGFKWCIETSEKLLKDTPDDSTEERLDFIIGLCYPMLPSGSMKCCKDVNLFVNMLFSEYNPIQNNPEKNTTSISQAFQN